MYTLLLVDDEPYAADGLFAYFQDLNDPDLNVLLAYSPAQALKLSQNRIDILVTDIVMPGMDGFDLQRSLLEKWPRMKVIFLTGNQSVDYAQKAIRSESLVDFILKTEESSVISHAVSKAITLLRNEVKQEDILRSFRDNYKQALPILRKDFFLSLLIPGQEMSQVAGKIKQLELELDENDPVIVLVGQLDRNTNSATYGNALYLAVDNLFAEFLSDQVIWYCFNVDPRKIIWIIQPRSKDSDWTGSISYIFSNLELVQENGRKLFGETVSFVLASAPCGWTDVSEKCSFFASLLQKKGPVHQMLILEDASGHASAGLDSGVFQTMLKKTETLKNVLTEGEEDAFGHLLQSIVAQMDACSTAQRIELVQALNLGFIGAINKLQNPDIVYASIQLPQYDYQSRNLDLQDFEAKYRQAAELVFQITIKQDNRAQKLIHEVNEYVMKHLDRDLSLSFMADRIYHSPSYFSRLYKHITGVSYLDYVIHKRMELAKDLLMQTNMKVADVAQRVNYDSVSYFIKAFKKVYDTTPSEYRKSNAK